MYIRNIDEVVTDRGLSRKQAFVLAAAALVLRIGKIVDLRNVSVSAVLRLDILGD